MTELSIYFSPVNKDLWPEEKEDKSWGSNIKIYQDKFPELLDCKIAVFGVRENRGRVNNPNEPFSIDEIRKQLYTLQWFNYFPSLVDLGDINQGKDINDTYFALEKVIESLVKKDIIPVIIGGSQDLTFPQYKGYQKLEQLVNMVNIDHKIDIGEVDEGMHSENYLTSIITHQPNILFNFSNIGHQVYFNSQATLAMTDKMYFETLRLGELNQSIHFSEPLIRNADMVSIDLRSIQSNDMPNVACPMPNGISGREICQMAWYAGMSDKLSSIGFYEYDSKSDKLNIGAMLVAQIVWYFTEGVSQRKEDFPKSSTRNYLKYTIHLNEDEHELIFFKSPKSDRWWVEVPYPDGKDSKYFRHLIVPCTYEDYQKASNGEMPDIWWQTFQKLT
jgi:arginase family enzyme